MMTSEIHSMVKVEEDEDRARLVTHVEEKERKFTKETSLLVSLTQMNSRKLSTTEVKRFVLCRVRVNEF